jgi:hypothetical protein
VLFICRSWLADWNTRSKKLKQQERRIKREAQYRHAIGRESEDEKMLGGCKQHRQHIQNTEKVIGC